MKYLDGEYWGYEVLGMGSTGVMKYWDGGVLGL